MQGQGLVKVVVMLPEEGRVEGCGVAARTEGVRGRVPEPFFMASLIVWSMIAAISLSVLYPYVRPRGGGDGQLHFEAGAAARCDQKVVPLQLPMMRILTEWGWVRLKRHPRQACARAAAGICV